MFDQRVYFRGKLYVVKALKVLPTGKGYTVRVFLQQADGDLRGTMKGESLETFLKYKLAKKPRK